MMERGEAPLLRVGCGLLDVLACFWVAELSTLAKFAAGWLLWFCRFLRCSRVWLVGRLFLCAAVPSQTVLEPHIRSILAVMANYTRFLVFTFILSLISCLQKKKSYLFARS